MLPDITQRLEKFDWPSIQESLRDYGYALTPALLTARECAGLIELYPSDKVFRSHIIMSRYRFGRGDYKYFDYPLPRLFRNYGRRAILISLRSLTTSIETWARPKSFPRPLPLSLPRARRMDKRAPLRCSFIMRPATSTACTRVFMAQLHSPCK